MTFWKRAGQDLTPKGRPGVLDNRRHGRKRQRACARTGGKLAESHGIAASQYAGLADRPTPTSASEAGKNSPDQTRSGDLTTGRSPERAHAEHHSVLLLRTLASHVR